MTQHSTRMLVSYYLTYPHPPLQRDIPFYVGCLTPIASSELAEQWAGHGPNGMGGYSFENEIRAMVLAREHANQPDLSSVPLAELLPKAQVCLMDTTALPCASLTLTTGHHALPSMSSLIYTDRKSVV